MKKCGGFFDVEKKEEEIKNLENEMSSSSFWDDPDSAQKIVKKVNLLKSWTNPFNEIKSNFNTLKEFVLEAQKEKEESLLEELSKDIISLEEKLEDLETKKMLSGELDGKSCYLSINAGAGGTESCDWAQMLSRMYERSVHKILKETKSDRADLSKLKNKDIAVISYEKNVTPSFMLPYFSEVCFWEYPLNFTFEESSFRGRTTKIMIHHFFTSKLS